MVRRPVVLLRRWLCHQRISSYHSWPGVYGYRPVEPVVSGYRVTQEELAAQVANSNLYRLVSAYREHGHKKADINPVAIAGKKLIPELEPSRYGLHNADVFDCTGILFALGGHKSVSEIVSFLDDVYAGFLSAEFCHLETEEERQWFAQALEQTVHEPLSVDTRRVVATDMLQSQCLDHFLAAKFGTVKRYGGEGAESMMAFFRELLMVLAADGVQQVVVCLPHRGRTNLLTTLLGLPPVLVFRKLRGLGEFPGDAKATGDVLSHLTSSVDLDMQGRRLHVTVLPNPSHLEAVNPVSMGKTRARQQTLGDGGYSLGRRWGDLVVNVQVHGDAAFPGQGVNQEMMTMARVPHYEVGGTIHLVVNNQLGFTTAGHRGRSSLYCTDLAKAVAVPVLHVNGDQPEMVVRSARLAAAYHRLFRKDVLVDLNCYRLWGHNELDDPTLTNPGLYRLIRARGTVPDTYAQQLVQDGVMTKSEVSEVKVTHTAALAAAMHEADTYEPRASYLRGQWQAISQAPHEVTTWDTGVDTQLLRHVGERSVSYPEDFHIHPHLLKTHVKPRLAKLTSGSGLDWATAEALALGSLLYQGYPVRLSGQDVGRGTFSQRHVTLVEHHSEALHVPLNHLHEGQAAFLEVANSILSEEAAVAYEYGVSVEDPNRLVLWEAQFGDFVNGAQVPVDTMVVSGEAKWMTLTGLTLLLPHGYEGSGPEHSSCRLERFLQLSDSSEDGLDGDDVSVHVAVPSTPAQYFHLLRSQMLRNYRKPLVVVTPKSLLRLPEATSSLEDMGSGTSFQPVIGDSSVEATAVTRVVLVSGRHYYGLHQHRVRTQNPSTAIMRVEGLSPFPWGALLGELAQYKGASEYIWSQEEPRNMGGWSYIRPRFEALTGRKLRYCGRPALGTPAVGVAKMHRQEAEEVIVSPFAAR